MEKEFLSNNYINKVGGAQKSTSYLKKTNLLNNIFRFLLLLSVLMVILIIVLIFITLIVNSYPAFKKFGIKFLFDAIWDPVRNEYGVLAFIIGTLLTSIISLAISLPFSLATGILLGEMMKSNIFSNILNSSLELLAGIPSVIYGMWGLFFMVPIVRYFQMKFGIIPYGLGIFTASLVLAIMIIPYSSSIIREVITLVPQDLKEAAYSLGATRFETIRKVILPYSSSGIMAGILLSFGRALGETMAVTMVIGNSYDLTFNIFMPGNTIASIIANEFAEASDQLYMSSLIAIGLVLFLVSLIFGIIGRIILKKLSIE